MAPGREQRIGHLFLSYAAADRERALAIADALESAEVPVWIDRRGIAAGGLWAAEISAAIRGCVALAILCTRTSVTSRNVRQELQLAWDYDRPMLPLLLEPVEFPDEIAYFLRGRQWIEVPSLGEAQWTSQISTALANISRTESAKAPPSVAPESESSVPAQSAGAAAGFRLPEPATALIGRDDDVQAITALLRQPGTRLVTLTGPGGVGKTRLALDVAHRMAGEFPDGAAFVDLAPVTDPDTVASAIAQLLGIRESGERSTREALSLALSNRQMLELLDNFEQVIAAAPVVAELVASAPELRVIVTSRESLRVRGEHEVTIQPLDLPDDAETLDPDRLEDNPAVSLFVQTASAAKPGFALTPENAADVAEMCRRLDGLPLAIELGASRVKHFPPATLLAHLEQRLPVLTGGPRDLPARQQTLRDTIAWSYDLLSPDEQALVRRLGIFVGSASIPAIEAVIPAAGALEIDLLSGLASLVDKSLVRERLDHRGAPRFSMLETIREFANEQLMQTGESAPAREALAAWTLAFVQSRGHVDSALLSSPANLRDIDDELDTIRLSFAIFSARGDAASCARLFVGIYDYLYIRGLLRDSAAMGRKALELAEVDPIPGALRGVTLSCLSGLVDMLTGPEEAESLAREGLALLQQSRGSVDQLSSALISLAVSLRNQGRYTEAMPYAEQAYALDSQSDREGESAYALYHIGKLAFLQDDLDRAVDCLRESLDRSLAFGTNEIAVYSAGHLAAAYVQRGEVREASSTLRTSARLRREASSGVAGNFLHVAAALAAACAQLPLAATLFAADAAQAALVGMRADIELWTVGVREAVRTQLGEDAYETASRAGQQLSVEEAIVLVMDLIDDIDEETKAGKTIS